MKDFFDKIKERIQRRMESVPRRRIELGKKREGMVGSALQELKEEGLINNFLATMNLSWEDVLDGVDFFIVYVDKRYKVCRLGVTGQGWVATKKRRHPENQIICVDLEESRKSVKVKILRAIEAQEENWQL